MSEIQKSEQFVIVPKMFNEQRVVTFADIDTVHNRKKGTASRNFRANKKHFLNGVDYIVVNPNNFQSDEIRLSGIERKDINNRGTTFLTETGYLMIVKSFTDDLSWKVQRQLVNSYFREQELYNPPIEKFPEEQLPVYQTSSTPVPKNPSWHSRNRRRINYICEKANTSVSTLYHHVLLRLGEEYDLNAANKIYEEEVGHVPKYAMDIVSYFPELARMADDFLDRLEKVVNKNS